MKHAALRHFTDASPDAGKPRLVLGDGAREWRLATPYYNVPELQEAHAALTQAVLSRLAPLGLDLPQAAPRDPLATWSHTLLGQTCGYRYVTELKGRVQMIGSPRYRVRSAEGPFICSALLVRTGDPAEGLADLRGRRCTFDIQDQASRNLLRADVAHLAGRCRFFGGLTAARTALDAAEAVVEGQADAVLIDGLALAYLQRFNAEVAGKLRPLLWTSRSPTPPFVTSAKASLQLAEAVRAALIDAIADPSLAEARRELLLEEVVALPNAHYRALLHFEQIAESQGYPELR
jgi:ABC-type phosphate/phosphonate transport system substrate-binding protein